MLGFAWWTWLSIIYGLIAIGSFRFMFTAVVRGESIDDWFSFSGYIILTLLLVATWLLWLPLVMIGKGFKMLVATTPWEAAEKVSINLKVQSGEFGGRHLRNRPKELTK